MSVVFATAGYDRKIRFWDAPSGRCTRMIKFNDSQINRLEITPDKQFIAAAGNPTIKLYVPSTDDQTSKSKSFPHNSILISLCICRYSIVVIMSYIQLLLHEIDYRTPIPIILGGFWNLFHSIH
jgi:WD40 repeat protein